MIDVADNNKAYYYHFDGLGSVVALSNSNGDSCQSYEYSVYGQVAASDPSHPNPYMFTGRRFDIETGLYYYRARYYNPHIGRFMQTDPVGYSDGINWYLYCRNNPLNFMDPSGLKEVTDEELGYLYKIRDSLAELVAKGYGSDVEALAYLSDCVVVYSASDPVDVNDYINTFTKVASGYLFDIQPLVVFSGLDNWKEVLYVDNENYPEDLFSDSGFKLEYKQEREDGEDPAKRLAGADQFTHFVGFMGAGFYAPGWVAKKFASSWERGNTDCADYRLALAAIEVGQSLKAYYESRNYNPRGYSIPWQGMAPSEVGDWILENLKK